MRAQEGESIAVLDLEGGGISRLAATERLLAEHPLVKVIILTIYNTDGYQAKSIKILLLQ